MLSDEDRRKILAGIRYGYLLQNPVAVDLSNGELSWSVPTWRRIFAYLSYIFVLCHASHKSFRLVYTFVFERQETELFEFIIHINFALPAVVIAFSYYFLFIQYPDIHAAVVKFSLAPGNHEANGINSCKNN